MHSRLELQSELESKLGSKNVYYQPPENFKMKYPAIRYSLSNIFNHHASNIVYKQSNRYTLVLISSNPLEPCKEKLSQIPTCKHIQSYIADNLYHDVFEIYY